MHETKEEFYFQWHITEKCNQRCKHCYHESFESNNELTLGQLTKAFSIIDQTLNTWQLKGSASLTGGEPFLREKELYKLASLMDTSSNFSYYDILTNGSLITSQDIDKLKKLPKLRRIQLSIESPNSVNHDVVRGLGNFDKTINTIRVLKEKDFEVSVMTTVSRNNLNEIPDLIDLLANEKVDTFTVERFIPEGNGTNMNDKLLTEEEVRQLYYELHELGIKEKRLRVLLYRPLFGLIDENDCTVGAMCSVGANALTIMHDGTIYPCRRLPISLGNILDDSLYKIWYDSEILWSIRDSNNLKGKCGNCNLVPICRGCRAMAYWATGDYLEEDPHCWKQTVPIS